MPKEEKVELEGEVVEALPNAMFRVKLDNDHVVLGHVAGKMRRFRIRIGDCGGRCGIAFLKLNLHTFEMRVWPGLMSRLSYTWGTAQRLSSFS